MDKFDGVPYGLFLGPKVMMNLAHLETAARSEQDKWSNLVVFLLQELEEVGGLEELEKEITRRNKLYTSSN